MANRTPLPPSCRPDHAPWAEAVRSAFSGVEGIDPGSVKVRSPAGSPIAYVEGTLTSPPDSSAAFDTIDRVDAVDGADTLVGDSTAVNKDVQEASGADNRLIIPIILVVVLLILAVLLRSIAAPVILLVTVVVPFAATGGVITSAGFVLAGTFTAVATLPTVFLAELGFVVAVGVLLDTIIVRSVLVTALNLDTGRHIWWPSHLARTDGPAHLADEQHPADPIEATGQPGHRA